jgi:hypothetical protein
MENGCLARMNLIGTRGKPKTVSSVPLKGLKLNISIAAIKIEASGSIEMLIPFYKANNLTLQRTVISTIYSA